MGTGSNAGRGQEAGRAWAGQAQVRWNRLCSLTAFLKLKAPHTHRAFVLYPKSSNTSQNFHPTHQNPTAGPCLGLGGNKKATLQPCFRRSPLPARRGPVHPRNQIFRICFCSHTNTSQLFLTSGRPRARHPAGGTKGSFTCTGGWVGFFFYEVFASSLW